MKNLSIINTLVLLAGLAGGVSASDLPDCVGDGYSTWNNCFGTYTWSNDTWSNGNKYLGEWKDGEQNGQGTGTFPDGEKYVGDWKDGKRYGEGTTTYPDGTIIDGIWKDGGVFRILEGVEAAEQVRIYEEQEQLYKERLARQERKNKYERIYNACLLDKGSDVDMSVSSLEQAVKATCDSIAEDPSFLEGLRYD